jgi:hypothetical protein
MPWSASSTGILVNRLTTSKILYWSAKASKLIQACISLCEKVTPECGAVRSKVTQKQNAIYCWMLAGNSLEYSTVLQVWATGWMIVGLCPGRGWEFFSSPPSPDRFWGPPTLLSNGNQGLFP